MKLVYIFIETFLVGYCVEGGLDRQDPSEAGKGNILPKILDVFEKSGLFAEFQE